jgi:hypothetical protein
MRTPRIVLIAALLAGVLPLLSPSIQPAGADVLIVTRKNDPNPNGCHPNDCSLREAVIASNNRPGPDVIKLRRGRYELTRPMPDEDDAQTGDLDILKNVTIDGRGPGKTIIDANRNDRIFHIGSNVDEGRINDLAIVGGKIIVDEPQEQGGGGILNFGKISLSHTVIRNNKAVQDAFGGGIWNGGKVVLTRSRVTGNAATGSSGIGGGIYNQPQDVIAELIFVTSRLDHNSSSGSGGGLVNTNGARTLFARSRVDHNRLIGGGCCGGGVYNSEGSTIEARNSRFDSNVNKGCCGGGLFSQDSNSEIVMRHSRITDNVNEGCCAGGLMAQGSKVVLKDTVIARNKSEGCCGGGVMGQNDAEIKLVNSRVLSNRVPNGCCGGGLMTQGGTLTLIGTLVRDNRMGGTLGKGGGISVQTSGLALVLRNSTVTGNSSTDDGGGIHIDTGTAASADLKNSTISGNTAEDDGAGIFEGTSGQLSFLHVTLTKNQAGGFGGGIFGDGGTWPILRSIIGRNLPNDCNAILAGPTGKNLDEDGTCFAGVSAIHQPPRLKPLADYGGHTPTHEPRSTSRAVDAVSSGVCPPPARDQRGVRRPKNGDGDPGSTCDLGAVERKP